MLYTRQHERPTSSCSESCTWKRRMVPLVGLLLLVAAFGQIGPGVALAEDESFYRSFVDEVGEFLYFVAWPTAEYERTSFEGLTFVTGGADVRLRLHGTSAFSGDDLWTDLVLEIRDNTIHHIRWGRNNAILAQPGETVKAWGDILAQLTQDYQEAQGRSPDPTPSPATAYGSGGRAFHFSNYCRHPLRLAIHYLEPGGSWRSEFWWDFSPGESAYLSTSGRKIYSNNTIWYYFARATDGSGWVADGDVVVDVDGHSTGMRKLQAQGADNRWSLSCD